MRTHSRRRTLLITTVALAIGLAGCTNGPGPVDPGPVDPGPGPTTPGGTGGSFAKGPNPTSASAATRGTFTVTTTSASGLGGQGGIIYSPTQGGTYGGIVLAPPFLVQNSANADTARFLASHGFVVYAFDASTNLDIPQQRAARGAEAIRYLTQTSSVRAKVDANRLGFGGFSMGGGATLELANRTPSLKAALPMVPWHSTKSFGNLRVPTLIIAAQNDTVATNGSHSEPFYRSIPSGTPKTLAEDRGSSHFMPSAMPGPLKRLAVSWMKRYIDNDTRYNQFTTQRDSSFSNWQQAGVS